MGDEAKALRLCMAILHVYSGILWEFYIKGSLKDNGHRTWDDVKKNVTKDTLFYVVFSLPTPVAANDQDTLFNHKGPRYRASKNFRISKKLDQAKCMAENRRYHVYEHPGKPIRGQLFREIVKASNDLMDFKLKHEYSGCFAAVDEEDPGFEEDDVEDVPDDEGFSEPAENVKVENHKVIPPSDDKRVGGGNGMRKKHKEKMLRTKRAIQKKKMKPKTRGGFRLPGYRGVRLTLEQRDAIEEFDAEGSSVKWVQAYGPDKVQLRGQWSYGKMFKEKDEETDLTTDINGDNRRLHHRCENRMLRHSYVQGRHRNWRSGDRKGICLAEFKHGIEGFATPKEINKQIMFFWTKTPSGRVVVLWVPRTNGSSDGRRRRCAGGCTTSKIKKAKKRMTEFKKHKEQVKRVHVPPDHFSSSSSSSSSSDSDDDGDSDVADSSDHSARGQLSAAAAAGEQKYGGISSSSESDDDDDEKRAPSRRMTRSAASRRARRTQSREQGT